MSRKAWFRVGRSLLVVLISIGVVPVATATTKPAAKPAAKATPKRPLYSTKRSQSRKARLARARAAAPPREMGEGIVAHKKVD